MTRFGLDIFLEKPPASLRGKRIGVLCHAASITSAYTHILDALMAHPAFHVSAVFGPQHGLFGQTQDNMIEWEGYKHPLYDIPVFSLYGDHRKPTDSMLEHIDALVIDLQDVGARPYTYIWTLKLCMEACAEKSIPVWVLDRPNPIGAIDFDGPLLEESLFSFVGGAQIPLCHRMTFGEIAQLLKQAYFPSLRLNVVWMRLWWRDSLWHETGLPWVLPSPNMPTEQTAIVYPGMVLLEATNVSEGRGTTRPFELFGAPYIRMDEFIRILYEQELGGYIFRKHDFIPTFQKWQGQYCHGGQIHVTDARSYLPVTTTITILWAVAQSSDGKFSFTQPPYEYDHVHMPIDILYGNESFRKCIEMGGELSDLIEKQKQDIAAFSEMFDSVTYYKEELH